MQLFRLAGHVVLRHRGLLALYVVMLGAFGWLMASYVGTGSSAYEAARPTVAVVDRDGSAVSEALADYAAEAGELVALPDTAYALQDAAAKDLANYVLVIPEGYGEALEAAARGGAEMPALECVVSYSDASGSLADQRVRAYAQQLYALLAETGLSIEQAVACAEEARASEGAQLEVGVIASGDSGALPTDYLVFMQFSTYALFGGTAILIACGLRSLGSDQPVTARLLAAPVSDATRGTQLALACLGVGLAVWAAMGVLGTLWCAGSLAGTDVRLVLLAQVPLLALACVGAAYGYLLWGLGATGDLAHAAGNMGSMVLTFLGGTWVQQANMAAAVTAVARLTPIWWVIHAMGAVYAADGLTGELVASVLAQSAIVALFAVAIAVAGTALARARARS